MNIEEKVQNRINSLRWARQRFEIAKYKPWLYNNSIYLDNTEWTDYYAVGKYISYEQYEIIERQYVNIVMSIVDSSNCKYLTLVCLSMFEKELNKNIRNKKEIYTSHDNKRIVFRYNDTDLFLMKKALFLKNYQRVSKKELPDVVKMLLRCYIFATLVNESKKLQFEFPGNYYMWLHCNNLELNKLKSIVKKNGLYLNPRD